MEALLQQISDWLKGMLVDGIMNNLSGMFDAVNQQVADVATQVGQTPANFSPAVFGLVRNISETVIIPIAGMFLTFIACYELIQLIIEHNNYRAGQDESGRNEGNGAEGNHGAGIQGGQCL